MDIAKLKTLLASPHPMTGMWEADDTLAAGQFNAEDITRIKTSMSGDEVFGATVVADFGGLTEHKQQLWLAF